MSLKDFFCDLYRADRTQLSLRERSIVPLRNSYLNSETVVSKVPDVHSFIFVHAVIVLDVLETVILAVTVAPDTVEEIVFSLLNWLLLTFCKLHKRMLYSYTTFAGSL